MDIKITEIKDFDLKDGYIVDGFPYSGYAGSIAAESMVRTSEFEFAGFMDSSSFPLVSIVREESQTILLAYLSMKNLKL